MAFASHSELDIASSEPPAPGTIEHAQLLGKVAFFTALGIPDNNILGTDRSAISCRETFAVSNR